MTLEEVRKNYEKGIQNCENNFVNNMWAVLRRDGMDGYVIRVKDGKKGVFKLNTRLHTLQFYPFTKSGRIALNPSGIVWLEKYLEDYKRCEE